MPKAVTPFYYPGNGTGCLLIHGFTGSPSEMRPLGDALKPKGWTVSGIRLSGHGTTPEDMALTGWEDWLRDAETGALHLREQCERVIAVGLSMGGLLALNLAGRGLVDGVVSMNAPIMLRDWRVKFAPLYQPLKKYVAKPPKSEEITRSEQALDRFVYGRVPVSALASLNRGIRQTRRRLKDITCPVLLMQSITDETVQPESVELIASRINQSKPPIIYWEKSGHILTLGPEREEIAAEVVHFVERIERG